MKTKTDFSVPHFHSPPRGFTRRGFLGTAAAATGVAVGSGLVLGGLSGRSAGPALAYGSSHVGARPLPGGTYFPDPFNVFIHHFPPGTANEPSQISDFNGLVANTRITGAGTGTNTKTGETSRLLFQADMGIMKGVYVGVDDRRHRGTFAFI